MDYKNIASCLCCKNKKLKLILDLGHHPLANNYLKTLNDYEPTFPLTLNLCENCYHLQLGYAVKPDILFKNYLYVSGTTQTIKHYFSWFAKYTIDLFESKKLKNVLEIACNDGSQLDFYKSYGLTTYGIDPAENLYPISSKNHNIICDYFSHKYIDYYKQKNIDIIVAQNVFAHTDYPDNFLKYCKEIMNDNSLLFLQTSQADMIKNNEFDTIYHEHLSFFSIRSMYELSKKSQLFLIDVIKTPIHGNSNLFVFSKKNKSNKIQELMNLEKQQGLYNIDTYNKYAKKCYEIILKLNEKINELKNLNYKIVGYGAAAKGMTVLNFGKIKIDFIIDDNPLKQNLYTPGMHIPITNIDELDKLKNDKIAFLPLAWNFFDEIKSKIKLKRNNKNDVFINYFDLNKDQTPLDYFVQDKL